MGVRERVNIHVAGDNLGVLTEDLAQFNFQRSSSCPRCLGEREERIENEVVGCKRDVSERTARSRGTGASQEGYLGSGSG